MKGITEIDERAALLLVRAYKDAYQSEGMLYEYLCVAFISEMLNKITVVS